MMLADRRTRYYQASRYQKVSELATDGRPWAFRPF